MSAFLQVRGVSLTYPSLSGEVVSALDGINLSLERGGFLSIVGPSGCGKTSLLKIVAGLIAPTTGEVIEGGSLVDRPSAKRGFVFQRPELYPWLTVLGNAEFGLRMQGMPRDQRTERAKECLELVRLQDVCDKYPHELSGGMQQRAAIARSLAVDPHVLLMDEPFGALDALTREHLQEELLSIWRTTGKTIVFVTHNVDEAVYLSTDVAVMSPRPGRVVATFNPAYSRQPTDGRATRASAEFVQLREGILSHIW